MYQTGGTIKETLDEIQHRNLVLPAIQREFVWDPDQICALFDSLMQGYPIGTFLYWKVKPETSGKFQFYDFVLDYHERDNPHCQKLSLIQNEQLTAVLDGQQRLTALNIGLRGSMARKLPKKRWSSPDAFPQHRLHLDLLWQRGEDDDKQYRFRFRTNEQSVDKELWFSVGEILSIDDGPAMLDWIQHNYPLKGEQLNQAFRTLSKLHYVVRTEKVVAFYEEKSQELEKVLQIFIRLNSGGTELSYSDLLLSVAVAQWTQHDARDEIHNLVDELNSIGEGFSLSKDLVLKAGLMLSDIGNVGFKVENFNRENMAKLESEWDSVKSALMLTVQLVSSFGFNWQNLSADSAILPIAYYLYRRKPGDAYLTHSKFQDDRRVVREWLVRSILKSGVWGSGLDTLLTALRQAIDGDGNAFPADRIYKTMATRGKSLVFDEEEIEELADTRYGEKKVFALLSFLFPFVDLRNHFHIDHIFPRAHFIKRKLKDEGVSEDKIDDFIQLKDGLANLQLLEGRENHEKHAQLPSKWLLHEFTDSAIRQEYAKKHLLGDVPETTKKFDGFYDARRNRLKEKIKQLLGREPSAPAEVNPAR